MPVLREKTQNFCNARTIAKAFVLAMTNKPQMQKPCRHSWRNVCYALSFTSSWWGSKQVSFRTSRFFYKINPQTYALKRAILINAFASLWKRTSYLKIDRPKCISWPSYFTFPRPSKQTAFCPLQIPGLLNEIIICLTGSARNAFVSLSKFWTLAIAAWSLIFFNMSQPFQLSQPSKWVTGKIETLLF